LRKEYLRGGQILIGSVGRLDKQKEYESLIHALARVVQVRPEVHLVIAGEGPDRLHLEALIRTLGLTRSVCLHGFENDVSTFLSALDVFVCSSAWEGGPYTVIEAILMKKPVVSTAVGFVPELLTSGVNGEVVPPGDSVQLAVALLTALEPGWNGLNQAETLRRTASDKFHPGANARELDRVFEDVVEQANAPLSQGLH
jgi:glycosyltransferase involved in cell wall biosynthesis